MKMIYRPTFLTLLGVGDHDRGDLRNDGLHPRPRAIDPAVAAGALRRSRRSPIRFVRASYAIILVPVWIQLALAIVFGAIAGVLLYRTQKTRSAVENEVSRQERERMLMTAEAISLLAAIWVTFQGLLAIRLIMMWQLMCCGLGEHLLPEPRRLHRAVGDRRRAGGGLSSVSEAGRCARPRTSTGGFRGVYFNRQDPALFVPLRNGPGLDRQFRPAASHCLSWTCARSLASGRPSSSSGSCSGNKTRPPGVLVSRGRHDPGNTHEKPCRKIARARSGRGGGPVRHLRSQDLSARVPLSAGTARTPRKSRRTCC